MEKKKIHREMTIEDIFYCFPQKSQKLAQELTNIGLSCVGCSAASYETVESGMMSHGMNDEDIDGLIDRLNQILEEKMDLDSITITETAANKFMEICKGDDKEGYHLYLSEKPAGCSGFEYVLDFAKDIKEDDLKFSAHGMNVLINKNQKERLLGCEIDFIDGLQGAGFKVSNPNAKSSCGCGSSHGY
jgi:iron-sulfur cluster assembly protein